MKQITVPFVEYEALEKAKSSYDLRLIRIEEESKMVYGTYVHEHKNISYLSEGDAIEILGRKIETLNSEVQNLREENKYLRKRKFIFFGW